MCDDKVKFETLYRRSRWYFWPPLWFVGGVVFTLITVALMDFFLYLWLVVL